MWKINKNGLYGSGTEQFATSILGCLWETWWNCEVDKSNERALHLCRVGVPAIDTSDLPRKEWPSTATFAENATETRAGPVHSRIQVADSLAPSLSAR
jgi:hypothetical protein